MDRKVLVGGRANGKTLELLKQLRDDPGFIIPLQPEVKILKTKKEIPTVIEWQGRRYILDDSTRR